MARTGRPPILNRGLIVDAALDLLAEDDDYERFSVRRLSDRLGVTNMAIYRHFDSRGALESAMEQPALEPLRDTDALAGCRGEEIPVQLMHRLYQLLLAEPRLVDLLAIDVFEMGGDVAGREPFRV